MKKMRSALLLSSILIACNGPILDVIMTVMSHGVGSG